MGRTKEDLVMELEELKGEEHLYEIGWLVSDDDDHIYRVLSSFKACSFKEVNSSIQPSHSSQQLI